MQNRSPTKTRVLTGLMGVLALVIGTSAISGQAPATSRQMSFMFKEHSRHHVPEGPVALGQMTFTEGDVVAASGSVAGTYNTRKIVIELTKTKMVVDNVVYVTLPNGTLEYMGITSTAPDYVGPPVATRPIVGGTGDFAGARGVVKTSADPKGIRVDITLN
jgi:hypothetical protein